MNKEVMRYHFVGIGGIGMSALARILLERNVLVSGSDVNKTENTDLLTHQGAVVRYGHSAKYISRGDTVVVGSAISESNPEYQAARALKCMIMHRSDVLADLMSGHQSLVVTGTHGKTTTSALLTAMLIEAGLDPTFALGGMFGGKNGKLGTGSYFVAEADESDNSFLKYQPHGAIITNVEAEHLDYYKSLEQLHASFAQFFGQVQKEQLLFYCGDDPILVALAKGRGVCYGYHHNNILRISNYRQEGWSCRFDIDFENISYRNIQLALPGEHYALNAAAVFGMGIRLGIDEEKLRQTLMHFVGVSRRCEKRGEKHSVLLVDDYAHHPTEVIKTLKIIKQAVGARRLIVLFQPHRYTRVRDFMPLFAKAFESADMLYITDIYSAGEAPLEGINAKVFAEQVRAHSTVPCRYVCRQRCAEELKHILTPHDVFLTMGAGDIYQVHSQLSADFPSKKLVMGLIFGGRSCEHEISLRSCRFVADSLDRELYDVRFFGINKEGKWILGEDAQKILTSKETCVSGPAFSLLSPAVASALEMCDLVFPVLHGTHGEDGTIQGFFELIDKPYVGPDYCSAAICMDKVLTKRLVHSCGVNTPKDVMFGHIQWVQQKEEMIKRVLENLSFPMYVKPIHLGSSVGITPVHVQQDLEQAIDRAFVFDTHVMIEEGKVGCRELEFAVLGNSYSFPIDTPAPGEKLASGAFVDYEKKYGQSPVGTTLYPEIHPEILEKGKMLVKRAYEAIGCTGMTRVDFLLDPQGEYWLFEMNAIPGMQCLSLFPKIWAREGLVAQQLFDRLVILALERHRQKQRHEKLAVEAYT